MLEILERPARPAGLRRLAGAALLDRHSLEPAWRGARHVFFGRTPELARGEEATAILEELARLSEPYGTSIEIRDGVGRVELG